MEQTHCSEMEGMKQEVSQLTRELHQRDIMIASSKGSALGLEQQLRTEIEKSEQMVEERRVNWLFYCEMYLDIVSNPPWKSKQMMLHNCASNKTLSYCFHISTPQGYWDETRILTSE